MAWDLLLISLGEIRFFMSGERALGDRRNVKALYGRFGIPNAGRIGNSKESMMRVRRSSCLIPAALFVCLSLLTAQMEVRDKDHQPDKVMDLAGLMEGMVVGEVGAGEG